MSKKAIEFPDSKSLDELSEDMEVVGPGQMLSEARKKLSISVDDVAKKLKFKNSLVENIELDLFDQKLPATFNRGYLRSYAKLVNVDVDEVMSAYDLLGVAEVQRSEMQSFSNLTEKQAEHSRLMWLSYLIAAILLGLLILWWQQEPKQTVDESAPKEQPAPTLQTLNLDGENKAKLNEAELNKTELNEAELNKTELNKTELAALDNKPEATQLISDKSELTSTKQAVSKSVISAPDVIESQAVILEVSTAVFTFSGDCWVNIYDATGERIAWGVKKSGYVMTVTGKAPLKVTLGKPELATIVFNGQLIDISEFNVGNIAKFTLPLSL